MTRLFSTTVIALALAASISPAFADQGQDGRSERVYYGDLNLRSDAGMARLNDRVERATRVVCDANRGRMTLSDMAQARKCRAEARRAAERDVQTAAASQWRYADDRTQFRYGNGGN